MGTKGSSPYTKERLEEAVRGARTFSEALERLGVDPKGSTRKYLRARTRALGVDTSHLQPEVKWTKEILEAAVSKSKCMTEVLRYLGLDVVGGHQTHISRKVEAYGIDVSHFRIPTQRGKPKNPRAPEALLARQEPDHARRISHERLAWAMTVSGVQERCALCGNEGIWHGDPIPLEVDHINGDWRDNRIENLRFLCPNCHSTTDSYRGRGKRRPEGRPL